MTGIEKKNTKARPLWLIYHRRGSFRKRKELDKDSKAKLRKITTDIEDIISLCKISANDIKEVLKRFQNQMFRVYICEIQNLLRWTMVSEPWLMIRRIVWQTK